jgi:DEAD/DEAH box helicase domain-containing protein
MPQARHPSPHPFFDPGEDIESEQPTPRPEPADINRLIAAIRKKYESRITGELVVPSRPARFADFPQALDARLRQALQSRGIHKLIRTSAKPGSRSPPAATR